MWKNAWLRFRWVGVRCEVERGRFAGWVCAVGGFVDGVRLRF